MILTDRFVYVHEPKTGGTFVKEVLYRIHAPGERLPRPPTHEPELLGTELQALTTPPSVLSRVLRGVEKVVGAKSAHSEKLHFEYDHTRYGTLIFWVDQNRGGYKHAGCSMIPEAYRDRPILATVRNPYDLYVSEYEFGWWKRPEYRETFRKLAEFNTPYAHFPDLTFEEYVRLLNEDYVRYINEGRCLDPDTGRKRSDAGTAPLPFGPLSERFVRFHFRNPEKVVRQLRDATLSDGYLSEKRYREDLFNVHFITTDKLNSELYTFLLKMGYEEKDVRFIRDIGRIRPQLPAEGSLRSNPERWEDYYTPELKRFVRERERMLFSLFPQFDV